MRKVTKEATKKEGVKKEKKVRPRTEAVADPAETPVVVEPAEALAAEPEIERTAVAATEIPTVEAAAEVPVPVESAPAPTSATALPAGTASENAKGAAEVPAEVPVTAEKTEVPALDLEALRKPVDAAKAALDAAEADAKVLRENARLIVSVARDSYRAALAPYRDACRKTGHPCEFEGGRGANVAERVGFLVERTDDGVCITIRGRPETMEVLPFATLKESVGKASYAYCDRWLGPKETIGNKGGGLGNRIRAVLK
jgi:hypothetical protein